MAIAPHQPMVPIRESTARQNSVRLMASILHPPRFGMPECADLIYVEAGKKYLFLLVGFCHEHWLGCAIFPRHACIGLRLAVVHGCGIVGHRHTHKVLKRAGLETRSSHVVAPAGAWYYDQLRTVPHQLVRRLRELSVGTDHRPNANLAFSAVEHADLE